MSDVLARAAEGYELTPEQVRRLNSEPVQDRAVRVLGMHVHEVRNFRITGCSCMPLADGLDGPPEQSWDRFAAHVAQMLADAGLLAGSAPVAGGNGAVAVERGPVRPTTPRTVDRPAEARLVAQRAATDAWKSEAERLRELLDEACARIERMEAL
ncbi:MAG: hypothetical protein M0Z51_11050 [Propionibacterium sp.]|nr:hypothetical protein [Propionibacterium sp.]